MLPALFARQRGHNAIEARRALKAKVSQTPEDDVLRDICKTTTDEKDGEFLLEKIAFGYQKARNGAVVAP